MARPPLGGIETRGISDHGFIRSIYFRDPNDYVVELSARKEAPEHSCGGDRNRAARAALEAWQRTKPDADAASWEAAGT